MDYKIEPRNNQAEEKPILPSFKTPVIASFLGIPSTLRQTLCDLGVNANCSALQNESCFKYHLNATDYRDIFSNNYLEPNQLKLVHIQERLKEKFEIDNDEIGKITPFFKSGPLSIRHLQKMVENGMKLRSNLFKKAFILVPVDPNSWKSPECDNLEEVNAFPYRNPEMFSKLKKVLLLRKAFRLENNFENSQYLPDRFKWILLEFNASQNRRTQKLEIESFPKWRPDETDKYLKRQIEWKEENFFIAAPPERKELLKDLKKFVRETWMNVHIRDVRHPLKRLNKPWDVLELTLFKDEHADIYCFNKADLYFGKNI